MQVSEREQLTTLHQPWLTKRRTVRDVWFWVLVGLLIIFGMEVWFLTRTLFISSIVTSGSMEPTLHKGDHILVRRMRFTPENPPQRGDIIFFHYPLDGSTWLVKRVIGLPGETVTIFQGRVYINGVPLKETYLKEMSFDYHFSKVPSDAVFVMGDNRRVSDDSRDYGPVPLELIDGKVLLRYYPFSRLGRVE